MTLEELIQQISDFHKWSFADKVRLFGWYLQTYDGMAHFQPADIRGCFAKLGLEQPSNLPRSCQALTETKPPQFLKSTKGYSLERRAKEKLDGDYGEREATIAVHKMLSELPSKVPGIEERDFLNEALTCFKHKAFRAAIVMAWNLAYDHFIRWIYNDAARLASFNSQLPLSYKKADISVVNLIDDFSFLKEHQVLTVAKSAKLISPSLHKVMQEKLDRRNAVAHPSNIAVHQVTAEDCIKDLVENVVLRLT